MAENNDLETPGWTAIDNALYPIYGGVEPFHYAPAIHARLGGPDPLDGISVYSNATSPEHWHFITYGFSELYDKESDDPDVSGYGFELTFRLKKNGEKEPPIWPLNFLQNLARYVFSTGRTFSAGHKVDLNGPIALGEQTDLCAIVFALDGELPPIETRNGKLEFLQIVGLTRDEYELSMEWDVSSLVKIMAEENNLLAADLCRKSILQETTKATKARARAAAEGSSQSVTYARQTEFRVESNQSVRIVFGAANVEQFCRVLRARLSFQRTFTAQGPKQAIQFLPHQSSDWNVEDSTLNLRLSRDLVEKICAELKAQRGEYSFTGLLNVIFEVVPTEITDGEGKKVVRVVG